MYPLSGRRRKVLGIAIDHNNRIHLLESSYSTTDPFPEPATGRLMRPSSAQPTMRTAWP